MATQKPISTISYNTEPFLREKLDNWFNAHIIQAYTYILHKGEDGDKDHIHLRIEPNKKLDPMTLAEELQEYVIGEKKPRGVLTFRSSKEEDWILYALHDKDYMKLKYPGDKGEKIPYKWEDIKCSERYQVETVYIRARQSLSHSSANLMERIQNGEKATKLIQLGENPYVVNALINATRTNEFTAMQGKITELNEQVFKLQETLDDIQQAIDSYGLVLLVDENGKSYLEKP